MIQTGISYTQMIFSLSFYTMFTEKSKLNLSNTCDKTFILLYKGENMFTHTLCNFIFFEKKKIFLNLLHFTGLTQPASLKLKKKRLVWIFFVWKIRLVFISDVPDPAIFGSSRISISKKRSKFGSGLVFRKSIRSFFIDTKC